MNQRTFLGLTHNPFTPPREGFFAGGDRKTHLDHLRHLSQWSRRILVVTGSFGIGKTSLFKELSGSLEPNTRAARLSGTVITSEREALVSLLQGFGIAADLNAHAGDLSDLVVRYVEEQDAQSRVCMVMVDDAHLMDLQAITRLVDLVAKSPLRLLLFAEASLISELNKVVKQSALEWFEIRLTGFPKSDVREYLEWRFNQAHYRGRLPFTDEQLSKIVDRSGGNPSVVDSVANRLLADLESGDIRARTSKFPTTHLLLVAVLAVMVGLIYVLVSDQEFAFDMAEPDASPTAKLRVNDDGAGSPETPAAADPVEQDAQVADSSKEDVAAADETLSSVWADEQAPPSSASTVEAQSAPEIPASAPTLSTTPGQQIAAAEDTAARVVEVVAASATQTLDTVNASDAPPRDNVSPVPVIESDAVTDPEPQPALATTPVTAPAPAVVSYKSAQWLLEQDPSRYTMQILTLSSRERAAAFIKRQQNPEEFAVYQLARDGKVLHVITYGIFSGRDSAASAADNLAGEMASLKPWIRPLRLVQDAVRGTPQS